MIVNVTAATAVLVTARFYMCTVLPIAGHLESSPGPGCAHSCRLSSVSLTASCRQRLPWGGFPGGPFSLASLNSCHPVPVVFQERRSPGFRRGTLKLDPTMSVDSLPPPLGEGAPRPGCPRPMLAAFQPFAAHLSPVVSDPEYEFGHAGIAVVPAKGTFSSGPQDLWADRLRAPGRSAEQ